MWLTSCRLCKVFLQLLCNGIALMTTTMTSYRQIFSKFSRFSHVPGSGFCELLEQDFTYWRSGQHQSTKGNDIYLSSQSAGAAAEAAATRKIINYPNIPASCIFQPLVFETHGATRFSALDFLNAMGDPRETLFSGSIYLCWRSGSVAFWSAKRSLITRSLAIPDLICF